MSSSGRQNGRVRRAVVALIASLSCSLALIGSEFLALPKDAIPANAVSRLTSLLIGTFHGTSPGNELTIVSSRIGLASAPASQLQRLDVRVTGTYQGDAVLLRGAWRISYQGDVVWLVFVPGVDPLEAARRFADPTFSPTELEAGCWTLLAARDDSFQGTIKPVPNCRNALHAGEIQSIDKDWTVRFSSEGMRFENGETGEILTFARTAAKTR